MVVVVMMVMSPPPLVVMMMMISKLNVIFCSGLFVHRVQDRRRVGNWFKQFGKRVRLQSIVGAAWATPSVATAPNSPVIVLCIIPPSTSCVGSENPSGGNASILEWFPRAALAPGLK